MRVGVVILPEHPWSVASSMWREAEALGFDHAWTYDHIAWGVLRDAPWFGTVPTLTAAATATRTIRLGPLVATPNYRHPVPFARDLIALDDISGGRVTVGLGAGGPGWDATILGTARLPARERTARFDEFVSLLDRLLTQPTTTDAGRFYRAENVPMQPGCVQRPRAPFAIAATGPRGMRLAAEHGATWVTTGDRSHRGDAMSPAEGAKVVRRQVAQLADACRQVGRDPDSIARLVLTGPTLDPALGSRATFDDAKAAYADAGVTDLVVHWPRPRGPYAGDPAALRAVVG